MRYVTHLPASQPTVRLAYTDCLQYMSARVYSAGGGCVGSSGALTAVGSDFSILRFFFALGQGVSMKKGYKEKDRKGEKKSLGNAVRSCDGL
jgi:hypothetical protein